MVRTKLSLVGRKIRNRIRRVRASTAWATFIGVSWSLAAYEAVRVLVDLLI